jgi:hypothetical protein
VFIVGVILVVMLLVLAWALAAGVWTAQHGDVRAQPFVDGYDSRRPRP